MSLLQRYFRTEALWPVLLSLSALAGLALLTQSLQTLDLIVENRQSAFTFFKITFLALPQLIAIIMPLSVFMAVLYALNRLHGDSELIVAKASGASAWQISSPFIRLGVFALIFHLLINLFVQPSSFRQMRVEILKVRTDIASRMIQEGQFVTPTPALTLYAREISADGKLKDVIIHDARESPQAIIHTANKGEVIRKGDTFILSLQNGSVQQEIDDGFVDVVEFDDYTLDLSDAAVVDTTLRLKTSDRFLHELLRPDPRELLSRNIKREYIAEGHARLSSPLYNLALVFLALSFMVRGEHQKMGYSRRIAICASLGFLVRLLGFGLSSAAEGNMALNPFQYVLPCLIILVCSLHLANPKKRVRRQKKRRAVYDAGLESYDQESSVS